MKNNTNIIHSFNEEEIYKFLKNGEPHHHHIMSMFIVMKSGNPEPVTILVDSGDESFIITDEIDPKFVFEQYM